MFERRLKWFSAILALLAIALIGRLYELQIVRAAEFDDLSQRLLTRPVRYLAAPRGAILDRNGRPLVADEPACDISVHYGVLAGRSDYLWAVARELRKTRERPKAASVGEIVDELRVEIGHMWQRLAFLTNRPVSDFIEKADAIRQRVERVRAAVERRTGSAQPVNEENMLHPLLEEVDNDLALNVRMELEKYPWLRVVPGSKRVARDVDALAHVLGRTGEATRERIDDDTLGDDELRGLRPGDRCGTSGIERAADAVLRGQRGRIIENMDRQPIERTDPVAGRDVRITIDAEWQRRAVEILKEAVAGSLHPAGASAVVLDAATREVLVLASYPTYSYEDFAQQFDELQRDTKTTPLLFRAVAAQYPPGSICKALTLIGGLSEYVISPETRIHCTGPYLKNQPNAFRCWIYNQNPGLTHDMQGNPAGQSAEDAVRNSCNIYFFTVGERLGAERLCDWFARGGLGRVQGTGLVEESPGIVPHEAWLQRRSRRGHQPSDAWNFAIGQGEVTCTPIQAANVAAIVATGRWAPVRLIRDAVALGLESPALARETVHEFDDQALRTLRSGMWRVVNERGGTAHVAKLDRDDYELLGKTGSAQTVPSVLSRRYTCEYPDGQRVEVIAASPEEALETFAADPDAPTDRPIPKIVGWRAAERYPELGPDEKLPSHAWFIGYTQPAGTKRGAAPTGRVYAISVIIEFGGSGGRVAGPAAKQIAETILADADGRDAIDTRTARSN